MMGKAWMIASGKGGAGKSTIAAALATALSQQKERVCIIDVDIGLRDQDLILGVENRIVYDLLDVLSGDCTLEEALVSPAPFHRLSLLPAAQFARSRDLDPKAFRQTLRTLKRKFDHVLIDCPAGIERGFRTVMANEYDSVILICTPDDVCIRNAERTVSLLDEQKMPRPQLIVNRLHANLIASQFADSTLGQRIKAKYHSHAQRNTVCHARYGCHCRNHSCNGLCVATAYERCQNRTFLGRQPSQVPSIFRFYENCHSSVILAVQCYRFTAVNGSCLLREDYIENRC